jgi:hypothetical protein
MPVINQSNDVSGVRSAGATSWHKAKYYVFLLGIYVSAHILGYVANHRITVANCRYSEKKRDERLQPLDVSLQVVAVNENPPKLSGTDKDSTKYRMLWKIFLALIINVVGIIFATYLFETYVWSLSLTVSFFALSYLWQVILKR